ncbi:MAG: hypothetical protein KC442_10155, partial [Thermomicrobiales bacterium]|nr:hypothetical protein [Thermomicrobiales bacterium]
MQISFSSQDPLVIETDLLILPVGKEDGLAWSESAAAANSALDGHLADAADLDEFRGKAEATLVLPTFGQIPARRVMLAGFGKAAEVTPPGLARAVGAALREARTRAASSVVVALPESLPGLSPEETVRTAALAAGLSLYRFDAYRGAGSKDERNREITQVVITAPGLSDDAGAAAIAWAAAVADGVNLARDLGNEPGKVLTPEEFARRSLEVGAASGLDVEVLGPEELAALGADAMLTVGGGSSHPPRLIRLAYTPEGGADDDRVVGLVGKAITFDTGGLSLKDKNGMVGMKYDKCGGMAVLGAMRAVAALKLPVPVTGVIASAENSVAGNAYRPNDIVTAMSGHTVEIIST